MGEMAQYLLGRGRHYVITYHSDVVRQGAAAPLSPADGARAGAAPTASWSRHPNYLESSATLRRFRDSARWCRLASTRRASRTRTRNVCARCASASARVRLLFFVGVLRYYKGLSYLLDAMPGIPARLLVVGEGPMAAAWRQQAQTMGLGDRVTFIGRVPDDELPAYYQAADLFVLPSSERSEAYGLVQVEALSAGLPVVCTELGTGTSYVNQHGETGPGRASQETRRRWLRPSTLCWPMQPGASAWPRGACARGPVHVGAHEPRSGASVRRGARVDRA